MEKQRLIYIDNLRIFLTMMVIVQHLMLGYGGATGRWYYVSPDQISTISWYGMTYLWLLNQAFFMGFFFLLASFFVPGSYDRKGGKAFIIDRLKRLGIPVVFYPLVGNLPLRYIAQVQSGEFKGDIWHFLGEYYRRPHVGIAWFVEALLIFSAIYCLFRCFTRNKPLPKSFSSNRPCQTLKNHQILIFGCLLGILVFVDRMLFPENLILRAFGLPRGHFGQYLAFFIIGIFAYRYQWLAGLTKSQGKKWGIVTIVLALMLPIIFILAGWLEDKFFLPYSRGVWSWQGLLIFAIWEQLIAIAITVTLLVWFRELFNYQTRLTQTIAGASYAIYLVHVPIVTLLIMAFHQVKLEAGLKFMFVTPIAITICCLAGCGIKRLPFVKSIM